MPLYVFTERVWETLHTGANKQICYGLKVTNPEWKKGSAYLQFWHVNDYVFRHNKEEILEKFEIADIEYDRLLGELQGLPTHA